ncbi:Ig-like domain-containing protein [Haloferula sp. BvORR071]|uniref:Ig-like domain-containing protein n=1 Tax=Haloferula sp. BvORR071 TaxID=1396141 RepID=UPI0006970E3B|nr:Ig-like domain-containing protein [Haloferula sp. BvORR071]
MKTSAPGLRLSARRCLRVLFAAWVLSAMPLGAAITGQFWWAGEGNPTDARIAYANNDGGAQTVNTDNSPTVDLVSAFPQDVGLDTAAGFYFAIVSSSLHDHASLLRGPIGGAAAPAVVVTFPSSLIVDALHVDPINKKIYTTWQDGNGTASNTGIRVYSYNTTTGAITDLGFLIRADADGTKPIANGGLDLLDVRDFDLDLSTNTLYFTELLPGIPEMGIYRINLSTAAVTQMVSSTQFPDSGSGGYIMDVEVDPATDKVYFTTESQHPFGAPSGYNAALNKLWVVAQGAANATATEVTLSGLPAGAHIYPGDMIFDQGLRQLYIESEESDAISTDDVIYVFQLDATGNAATLVRTITPSPAFDSAAANIQGMAFDTLATFTMTATASHVVEQGSPVVLLATEPVIADIDGVALASATVTITGSFAGSGDDLFVSDGAVHRISGVVSGTSIAVSRTTDGGGNQKLTLTGYDTFAHYQQVLGEVLISSLGDNPTNFGNNVSRTVTWQINDGAAGNPAMSLNAAATNLRSSTVVIDPVNDAPVNVKPANKVLNEDSSLAIAGFSIGDVDAAPSSQLRCVLSVDHGTLTIASAGGAVVNDSGKASVTLTGTIAQINTTLAAANNVVYTPSPNFAGSDALLITTNDDGNTGSPGAQTDSDKVDITVNAVNDNPVTGDDIMMRYATQPTNAKVAALLGNDSDVDGDSLVLLSVGGASNGVVSLSGDMVTYTPAAGYLGGDSFTYNISDGHGGSDTGIVTVIVVPGHESANIEMLTGGVTKASFNGIPGMTYRIQSSDTLAAGSWVNRVNVTANGAGGFSFTDPAPLPKQRFYRCVPP